MGKLKIPEWFNNKPDDCFHRSELKSIEEFILGKGFKLESAHNGWVKDDLASIFFNIIAETKMSGYYDCIRTWVKLKTDMTIEWCIQVPAQGSEKAHELFHNTDDLVGLKYRAALEVTLKQYKPSKQKATKVNYLENNI